MKSVIKILALAVAAPFLLQGISFAQTGYKKIKNPEDYGNVIMEKNIKDSMELKPVLFRHWTHRVKYTCKVCHTDIGFQLKTGATEIKQADIEGGKFCGACHNGKTAFGSNECASCHSYGGEAKDLPKMETVLKGIAPDDFGNKVDWVKALRDGSIKPSASAEGGGEMAVFDLDVHIPASKFTPHPPDVVYPHKAHTEHLDCSSCHTDIFQMQKGGNPEMNMLKIISGRYCGVCHGKVSFPLEDCSRCHSQPPPPMEAPGEEAPTDKQEGAK